MSWRDSLLVVSVWCSITSCVWKPSFCKFGNSIPFNFSSAPWILRFGFLNASHTLETAFLILVPLHMSWYYFVLPSWNLLFFMVLSVNDNVCCGFLFDWHLLYFSYFCLIVFQCFNLLVIFPPYFELQFQFIVMFTWEIVLLRSWTDFLNSCICLFDNYFFEQ